MNRVVWFYQLMFLAGCFCLSSCGPVSTSNNLSEPSASSLSIEQRLIQIDTGRNVRTDDPLVKEYSDRIDSILAKSTLSADKRDRIGELLAHIKTEVQEKGVNEDLLTIAKGLDEMMPEKRAPYDLAQFAAAYIISKTTP